ncbi:phenylalanine--tRNA ligase subunit beta [Candidatus Gottesmanbacteria bacterium RIFCSPHIGHO2_01_FULL_42_12]|uniref:Phenylalanine--tRNA ligase beta subunit n=1 Tax=Candidatus Gottesmanbacteria bacterium RIFCSPHIGHO2_01_FULL_42_12 TaxID=1798377 RepID=A0A1F5Z2B7_9BACT|nr:MAG: phenylalanine--tRNA ligase subunit beta [Candidatus Gottesmanbacteria bacterium RIFCSPHIGHO2_01_FULL_42_12]
MLIPLSWLKEYVDIKIPASALAAKLSAAGLTVEKWEEREGDTVLDSEITPNRPDWMSVYGTAREAAAILGLKLNEPKIKLGLKKINHPLPITIKPNYEIVPRITSVVISNITVKPSPEWLQKRIKQIGLRPINNLVDITNYVLWLYGGLLHVFDYDKIRGKNMSVELSKGGEAFRSLDGIDYILPQGAIIIKDVGRVIDLLPLKGGENTASYFDTKNVLLHSVIVDPIITRRTSQALGLRSDSSAIAERGLDPNVTLKALTHAMSLIVELAGGVVASEIIDHKEKTFEPWKVTVSHEKIERVLGIKVDKIRVKTIFESLGFGVKGEYTVTVPTFRSDIHLEEDLIEEVGRIIGYDNIPKTLPATPVPIEKVAYSRDFDFEYEVKQELKGAGYSEIYSYSLVSKKQILDMGYDPEKCFKILNPISLDFEYLRPQLFGNLLDAYKLNQPQFSNFKIYELGKRYLDGEEYWLWGAQSGETFLECKGVVEKILLNFGVNFKLRPATTADNHYWFHPGRTLQIEDEKGKYMGVVGEVNPSFLTKWGIKGRATMWALNYDMFVKLTGREKLYQSIPKFPPIIEDITLTLPKMTLVGEVMEKIKSVSKLISHVELISVHEQNYSFRITYLDRNNNLTDKEIEPLRRKIAQIKG